jgi:hypothetical protein
MSAPTANAPDAMPQERPDPVLVDAAPRWAREVVARLRSAEASSRTGVLALEKTGVLWFLPDATSAFWTRAPARSLSTNLPYVAMAVGLAVLGGAVLASRAISVPSWVWAAGVAAALVGAIAKPATGVRRRRWEGMLVTADGLVRTEGTELRIAARADVHDVRLIGTGLYVLFGSP